MTPELPVSVEVPASHRDLLERPLVAILATVRPDGAPLITPAWFEWRDGTILLDATRRRQRVRNIRANPAVSVAVLDPENPYRYIELRGVVKEVRDDSDARFYGPLAARYGVHDPNPEQAELVVLIVRPTHVHVQ